VRSERLLGLGDRDKEEINIRYGFTPPLDSHDTKQGRGRVDKDRAPSLQLGEINSSDATIETLNINDALEIGRLKANTLVKGMIVLDKLRLDERQRLSQTLDVMRACRLFNYEFVSKTPLLALEGELVQLNRLPGCVAAIPAMEKELKDYKTIANAEMEKEPATRRPLWPFWVFNMLQIPS
jgi:hypothetical protein